MSAKMIDNSPADASSRILLDVLRREGQQTVFDRFQRQQPSCKFGVEGVCCTLCSDGPCQISKGAERGVCGASADLIVARNLLLKCAQGTAANVYHARNVALALKAAGEGNGAVAIRAPERLAELAARLELGGGASRTGQAAAVGRFFLDEINGNDFDPMRLLRSVAPAKRLAVWEKLGILPGGPHSEIATGLAKAATHGSSDVVDLLLHCLRLGIANEAAGLWGISTLQDILLGAPELADAEVDLGVLDAEAVNVVMHGHQPLLAVAVLEAARTPAVQAAARQAGARNGLKVFGSMCGGQQLAGFRRRYADVFHGQIGGWIQQELMLATGAVDVLAMDYNCVVPGLAELGAKYHTRLVTTDLAIRQAGVDRMESAPGQIGDSANRILAMAIEAFGKRGRVDIPAGRHRAMVGFTTENVVSALGGSVKPLVDAIASGSIRGVAAVVGCTTVREGQSGRNTVKLVQELIRRDILVIGAGCATGVMQTADLMSRDAVSAAGPGLAAVCRSLGTPPCLSYGSCTDIGKIIGTVIAVADALGVDIPALPVVASAPEHLEQKAVADAFSAVAYGLTLHLAPAPPVLGSALVTRILTHDVESLTGGKVFVELDPVSAVDAMEKHIATKRRALGLP